jgi:ribosomal protein L37AE/L43A
MGDYLEIARRTYRDIKEGRIKVGEPDSGRVYRRVPAQKRGPFSCSKCDTRFDTSIGKAWHEANDCAEVSRPSDYHARLPACSKCGSFALYREEDGNIDCQSCGSIENRKSGGS